MSHENRTDIPTQPHPEPMEVTAPGAGVNVTDGTTTHASNEPPRQLTGTTMHDAPLAVTNANPYEAAAESHRELADVTARSAGLTPGTDLEFHHAEVTDTNIRYIYNKVFNHPRKESPSTVIVVFDRKTGQAELLRQE